MIHNSEIYFKLFSQESGVGTLVYCFLLHLLSQITSERKPKVRNQVKRMICQRGKKAKI